LKMMKVLVIALLAAIVGAQLTEEQSQWLFSRWVAQYNKAYASAADLKYRYNIWQENMETIRVHNELADAGKYSYTLAMNEFGDLSHAEFLAGRVGKVPQRNDEPKRVRLPPVAADKDVDWRTDGAVTPVKNQQQCGSCWSFSTTGSTEGCHALKAAASNPTGLSEQNLVDCSDAQGNQGCDGGLMTQAMDYIIQNKGIDTEASYPYTAEDGTCSYNAANSGGTLSSYTNVQSGDEGDLQAKVVTAPVSIAIDASHSSFQFYSSGVYIEPDCSSSQLDHGVLAAGYGTLNGKAYWRVKNSWGTDWGLQGFILMAKDHDNQCGVATMATIPVC